MAKPIARSVSRSVRVMDATIANRPRRQPSAQGPWISLGHPQPRDEAWRRPSLLSPRQIQALSRTAPNLPLRLGGPERRTHDFTRHGTTTLFAALEVATGRVADQCFSWHRHAELLAFLKLVVKAYPRRQLHVVLDNYGTHTHAEVNAWLARHPRI
jgi:DDE superfamily endonuclease